MTVDRRAVFQAARDLHPDDREVVVGDDAAVARHAGELFGTPTGPNPTPPGERYVPSGRVLVEWLGDASPYGHAQIAAAVELGLIPRNVVAAYELHTRRMTTRIDTVTHHTMTRERDGMGATVTWGPHMGSYVQEVSAKDADVLLSGTDGHQFRVVGRGAPPAGEQPADRDLIDRFVPPALRPTVRAVVIEEGGREALIGVGGRGRIGAWTPTP